MTEYNPKFQKPGKKPKGKIKTKEDEDRFVFLAWHGCVICKQAPHIHHIRISGEPRDNKKTIPLCPNHHTGKEGIHTLGKREWRKRYGHEMVMLEEINKIYHG